MLQVINLDLLFVYDFIHHIQDGHHTDEFIVQHNRQMSKMVF